MIHNTHVFYHNKCTDGFHAASLLSKVFNNLGKAFNISAVDYNLTLENYLSNLVKDVTTLWFVDFCPTGNDLQMLLGQGYHVIIIDHHKTAIDTILELDEEFLHDPKLRYCLAINGFCGSSLVSAFGDCIPLIECTEGLPRTFTHSNNLINDTEDFTVISNFEIIGSVYIKNRYTPIFTRERLTTLDRLIEAYDLQYKNDSYLYRDSLYFQTLIDSLDLIVNSPKVNGIESLLRELGFSNMNYCISVGKSKYDAIYKVLKKYLDSFMKEKLISKGGVAYTRFTGVLPFKTATMLGTVIDDIIPNEQWLLLGINYNLEANLTRIDVRSSKGLPSLALTTALGGGGHPCASGKIYSGIESLVDVLTDIDKNASNI